MLHQVGAGTLGPVFRAHDPDRGRLVAVKAFRLDLIPERAADFAAALNGLAARSLDHPSIAAPIAAGVEGTTPWLAQAYVPAESLDSALRQYGRTPLADALAIVTELAGALDFAAAEGVLHGALHPRDVLVAPDETHLVDLGVAAALEGVGLRAPVRRPYAAPERIAGAPISRAADIFSLGAIAYEVITGARVAGAGDEAVASMPDIPGAHRETLIDTFAFALAVAPDERFTTALGFVAALKKALGDAPSRAAAAPAPEPAPAVEIYAAPVVAAVSSFAEPSTTPEPVTAVEEPASVDEAAVATPVPPGRAKLHPRPPKPAAKPARQDVSGVTPAYVARPAEPAPAEPTHPPVALDDLAFRTAPDEVSPAEWETDLEPRALGGPPPRAVERDLAPVPERVYPAPVPAPTRPIGAMAVMLVAGIAIGLAAGWYLLGRPAADDGAPTPEVTSAKAAATRPVVESPGSPKPDVSAKPRPAETAAKTGAPKPVVKLAKAGAASPKPDVKLAKAGQLVIRSTPPGARVEVNGRARGQTPVTVRDLALGAQTVRVMRSGYATDERHVTLTSARPSQAIDIPLARAGSAASPARGSGEEGFFGTMVVETRPTGARVFLDERAVGTTPLDLPKVSAGSHVVRLELDGFKRWTASVQVVAGERNRVAASLEEEGVR